MPTFRSYTKSEDAYSDAAFLCGMGLNATVFDERALGGNLLGPIAGSIRIDLPAEQLAAAAELFATRGVQPVEQPPTPSEITSTGTGTDKLSRFFRAILVFDLACCALLPTFGTRWVPTPPPAVEEFLVSLALSDFLWRLAFVSYWPEVACIVLSNILCFFYSRFGRTLFAFTLIWSLLMQLGPPPQIYGPLDGFIWSLQGTLATIALALMYWSPLNERFRE